MGTGTLEVQIFVSLAVILGTALIALIVDYLKGNNENLREHNIELRVRQQERDKTPMPGRRRARVTVAGRQQVHQQETPVVAAVSAEAESIVVEQEAVAVPATATAAAETESIPVFVEEVSKPVEAEAAHSIGDLLTQVIAVTPAVAQRLDAPTEIDAPIEIVASPEPVIELPASVAVEEVAPASEPAWVMREVFATLPEPQAEPVVEPVAAAAVEAVPEPVAEIPQQVHVEEAQEELPEPSNIIFIKPVGEPVEAPARFRSMEFSEIFDTPIEAPAEAHIDASPAETTDSAPVEFVEVPAEVPEPVVIAPAAVDPFVFRPYEEKVAEIVSEQAAPVEAAEAPSGFTYDFPVASRPVMYGSSGAPVLPNVPDLAFQEELPANHWSRAQVVEPTPDTVAANEFVFEEPVQEVEVVETTAAPEIKPEPEPCKPQLVAPIEPSIRVLEIPIGLQPSAVFETLLATPGVLSGVVVAIGINDYQQLQATHSKSAFEDLMRSVTNLVESIAANKGMAVRRSEDEFIVIFPQDSGSMGQRRLTQISERLWDFQLRSLGSFSILFSWGAVEVASEQINEAIDAANEQMYQTKRTRSGSFDATGSRKRAVNL